MSKKSKVFSVSLLIVVLLVIVILFLINKQGEEEWDVVFFDITIPKPEFLDPSGYYEIEKQEYETTEGIVTYYMIHFYGDYEYKDCFNYFVSNILTKEGFRYFSFVRTPFEFKIEEQKGFDDEGPTALGGIIGDISITMKYKTEHSMQWYNETGYELGSNGQASPIILIVTDQKIWGNS